MKKSLLLFAILTIMGCGGERDNQVGVGISDKVYTVIGFKRFTICTIYSSTH